MITAQKGQGTGRKLTFIGVTGEGIAKYSSYEVKGKKLIKGDIEVPSR